MTAPTNYPPSLNNGENIFVFGSNLAGRHGKGAARQALLFWGAIHGWGSGPQGKSYAIPTKDSNLNSLPLDAIQASIRVFITYAQAHPNSTFLITRVACGLAGYHDRDIAPMFADVPINCVLPTDWIRLLMTTKAE